MTYALGIVLDPGAVHVATRSLPGEGDDGPTEQFPTSVYLDGNRAVVGADAQSLGASRPGSMIDDVVGSFDKERSFLTGGRLLNTDDAMRELLTGLRNLFASSRSEPPAAVTIACPPGWGPPEQQRVAAAATAAGLANTVVIDGMDPQAAAADAATRLPQWPDTPSNGGGARRESEHNDRRRQNGSANDIEFDPHRTEIGRNRRAVVLSSVAVGALVVALGAFAMSRDGDTGPTSTVAEPATTASTVTETTDTNPERPLTVGLLTGGPSESAVRNLVVDLNGAGGALGQDVTLVVQQPTADTVAEATTVLLEAGASAIVSDLTNGGPLEQAQEIASRRMVPVCAAAETSVDTTPTFVGTPERCLQLFVLAAHSVGSSAAGPLGTAAESLVTGGGVDCSTFPACRSLIEGRQTVHFQPDDTLRRAGAG